MAWPLPAPRTAPGRPLVTGRGLLLAAAQVGRALLLLSLVGVLGLVRTSTAPQIYAGAVAVCLVVLYLCVRRGSDFRVWVAYVLAFVLFAHLRTLADETGLPARYQYVIAAENGLFLGTVPTLWLQEHLYRFGRVGALDYYTIVVYLTYFFAPHLSALACWRLDPARFRPFVLALLLTFYLGLALCYLVPTAPPWLAGQTGELPRVFRIVKDVANSFSPHLYQQGYQVAGSNDVAAMPSLHMAITVVIALAAGRAHPLLGALAWLYAASMGLALVYLGEHYVVDLMAGLATAVVAWRAARWWWARQQARAALAVASGQGARR